MKGDGTFIEHANRDTRVVDGTGGFASQSLDRFALFQCLSVTACLVSEIRHTITNGKTCRQAR